MGLRCQQNYPPLSTEVQFEPKSRPISERAFPYEDRHLDTFRPTPCCNDNFPLASSLAGPQFKGSPFFCILISSLSQCHVSSLFTVSSCYADIHLSRSGNNPDFCLREAVVGIPISYNLDTSSLADDWELS